MLCFSCSWVTLFSFQNQNCCQQSLLVCFDKLFYVHLQVSKCYTLIYCFCWIFRMPSTSSVNCSLEIQVYWPFRYGTNIIMSFSIYYLKIVSERQYYHLSQSFLGQAKFGIGAIRATRNLFIMHELPICNIRLIEVHVINDDRIWAELKA